MRILIDIGHPAHVYIFRNIVLEMQKKGHTFLFTVRSGENEAYLLNKFGFKFKVIGRKQKGIFFKLLGLLIFTFRIALVSFKFKPDLFLSHGSMYAGYASRIFGKSHIALEDSGNREQLRFSLPVSDVVLTPEALTADYGSKHIRYNGYHELMYLSPKYFVPDESLLESFSGRIKKPYAILRFVSWEASHDKGKNGLTWDEKRDLVQHLLSRGINVFISAEKELPPDLILYRLDIPFYLIHHLLAFATIYIGEGATMASEAGILGIPSFYISLIRRCYNDDQEKYGTVYNFPSFDGVLSKVDSVLDNPQIINNHKTFAKKLIKDKIEVTDFIIWFIENWPSSNIMIKKDPNYPEGF
jgi:predicted glycosyltransferase